MTSQNSLITYNTNDTTSQSITTSKKIPYFSEYNPRDRLLFGWSNKKPVYYLIELGELKSEQVSYDKL